MTEIKKVAVLGAGTMGFGIAGVCANAGCQVLLLDLEKSASEKAKEKLVAGRSPVISDETVLERISTGSFDADLQKIKDCDWICEVVVENVEIKRELFKKVEAVRGEGSIISTNTSGIPLRDIYQGMPERLQQDIAVTHFFNPVHIMKLVELVPGEKTRPEVISTLADFLGQTLNKGVVYAKDTVNFIGNRIGCMWMLSGLHIAEESMAKDDLTIESIDALMSEPVGLPATGLYGLVDLIGLDVMFNVGKNLETNLPDNDAGRAYTNFTKSVQTIFDRGQLGRKTGGGFYKLTRHDDGSKTMEVFDLQNDQWRAAEKPMLSEKDSSLESLYGGESANARFVTDIMTMTLSYSAELVPEIADDIVNVDRAMRWGFGWKKGPFELIDQIGADRVMETIASKGLPIPRMLNLLKQSDSTSFYRDEGKEYFGTDGEWHPVA
ncbi:MAG: 3-hydroxyacyl-CoA dehydrogenase [Acidiferrobacterales bacterium]|nr:3-hydroxyacyl-CoA dehydrogenase [Acidiferrobacterales bacterium]